MAGDKQWHDVTDVVDKPEITSTLSADDSWLRFLVGKDRQGEMDRPHARTQVLEDDEIFTQSIGFDITDHNFDLESDREVRKFNEEKTLKIIQDSTSEVSGKDLCSITRTDPRTTPSDLFDFISYVEPFEHETKPSEPEDLTLERAMAETPELTLAAPLSPPPVLPPRSEPSSLLRYMMTVRQELTSFQEAHGLSRTVDSNFLSLGLALAQEAGRAFYTMGSMLVQLFPVISIVSLLIRFILDELIDILETPDNYSKFRKMLCFIAELLIVFIILYLVTTSILLPLSYFAFMMVSGGLNFLHDVVTSP